MCNAHEGKIALLLLKFLNTLSPPYLLSSLSSLLHLHLKTHTYTHSPSKSSYYMYIKQFGFKMCAPARTRFLPSSFPLLHPPPTLRRLSSLIHRRHHCTPIKMSSSDQNQIIEHVVLIKVKPDVDSSKVSAMVNGLNALTSLNLTVHLTAGKLLRSRSSSLTFTHMLHARYKSKTDLQNYAVHPEHVRVVTENIKPVLDDIMAVDWISTGDIKGSGSLKAGSAIRVTFLKLKENLGENEKARVLEVIGGIKNQFKGIVEFSCIYIYVCVNLPKEKYETQIDYVNTKPKSIM